MSTGLTDPPTEPVPRPGAVARMVSWSKRKAERATSWALGARATHSSVDVGFRLADRDKRVAAGVLAGGIAYRLFFWLLSVSLLAGGALGFADGHRVKQLLTDSGLPPEVVEAVRDVSHDSQAARWWLIILGVWLVLWTGYLGAKALVLIHAAVWEMPPVAIHKPWWASLGFSGGVIVFAGSMALVQWGRTASLAFGVLATVVAAVVPLGFWIAVSLRLPHRGVGWRDLLPGAVVVAIGVHGMYLFTTWFLGPKLASATHTYGLLGVVATMLFWLYVSGRLVIGSATLNVSVHDHRTGTNPSGP